MITNHTQTYRVTPARRGFRVEAVTGDGEVELLAAWSAEEFAIRQLRELQQIAERVALQELAAEESPRGPRGRPLVTAVPTAGMSATP